MKITEVQFIARAPFFEGDSLNVRVFPSHDGKVRAVETEGESVILTMNKGKTMVIPKSSVYLVMAKDEPVASPAPSVAVSPLSVTEDPLDKKESPRGRARKQQ